MTKNQIIEKYGIEEYNRRLKANRQKRNDLYKNDPNYHEKYKMLNRKNQINHYHKNKERRDYMRIYSMQRYVRNSDLERIENYELAKADNFKGWDIHHRLEFTINGEYAHTKEELIRMNMYYDRPYFELIFMKTKDHHRIHTVCINQLFIRKK